MVQSQTHAVHIQISWDYYAPVASTYTGFIDCMHPASSQCASSVCLVLRKLHRGFCMIVLLNHCYGNWRQ